MLGIYVDGISHISGSPWEIRVKPGVLDLMYSFTRSGKYLASVGKLTGSGLSAHVYSGSNHFLSVKESISLSLDGPPIAEVEWNSAFEIIWNGFIILPYEGNVTFQSVLTNNQDRVAIWMDNQIIFDQWSSIDKLISSWNFYSNRIDSSHPISVRFSHRYGYCKFDIKWSWSGVDLYSIPVTQLFSQISHIQGSPFDVVIVPGFPRATATFGSGLTIAVVGNVATFIVTTSESIRNDYVALTSAGVLQLYASVFSQVGLFATYYDLNDDPSKVQILESFSSSAAKGLGDTNSTLRVNMQGFLFNLSSGEYAFNVGLGQDHERTSSSYTLNSDKNIVEVQVEYKYDFASTGLQIMWMGPGFGMKVMQSIFFDGDQRCFRKYHISEL
ncbi:hypothetical protein GUITHDRAFT_106365 [Guillardia theta CCMP2712]|uniref:PA14 domain-containing protein n=1 Tax=Guillardia theta (strain CCMP2712) TaxID=905079 RepID=L1JI55_GUITC|nr:hypothetical protein GUITHDRAFT_106365 [Guillardia theta CCMP2712]EKX47814.1 hypothetical protein GUITHDRAFT_106365 [Guillardia theta CCMP2712]|eukprot:XP_005834794.1 hypothetical protein GUITHDRAFT_106365 [Guillardia theta CCMP2712]